jgi:multidrug efflux pump subunit AcrA (membrane-fusion protein)
MKMPETININTKNSEEIEDIITIVPSWITRWGTAFFFFILLFIIFLCASIRYPDIVRAQVKIRPRQSPQPIVVDFPGRLFHLKISQYAMVKKGQELASFKPRNKPDDTLMIRAPRSGKVFFSAFAMENQDLTAGQEVFYIGPDNAGYFGEIEIVQEDMGKIKIGQEVLIKLKSYPFEEFGLIRGRIDHIGEFPYKDSVFLARANFQLTNFQRETIHLKQGMNGQAEIITADATLFQRLRRTVMRYVGHD